MRVPRFDNNSFNSLRHFMTNLRYGAHCAYYINIHLVLVVAYRRKAITKSITWYYTEGFASYPGSTRNSDS